MSPDLPTWCVVTVSRVTVSEHVQFIYAVYLYVHIYGEGVVHVFMHFFGSEYTLSIYVHMSYSTVRVRVFATTLRDNVRTCS